MLPDAPFLPRTPPSRHSRIPLCQSGKLLGPENVPPPVPSGALWLRNRSSPPTGEDTGHREAEAVLWPPSPQAAGLGF